MKLSEKGFALIRKFEGLKLTAYQCSAHVWTIGYGSTRGVREGMTITEEEAEDLLWKDVKGAENCVNANVHVPMTQGEFDALVSFVFNLGCGAFGKSTLLRKLNGGDYDGSSAEFGRWNKAAGKELAGLTRRREAEQQRFEEAA